MSTNKSQCVIGPIDAQSRVGRNPFARPGVSGNRWIKFGCDGQIPAKYLGKVQKAVTFAYELNNRKMFRQNFEAVVKQLAKGKTRSYLDALDTITINLADTSTDSIVKKEMKDALEAKKQDPTYQIEGGFTIGTTGRVFIREFALANWSEMEIAGLISHEATHVAGAPGDLISELVLAILDKYGYRRRPID